MEKRRRGPIDIMHYKGYTTEVQVDIAGGRLYGKVLGIEDVVKYEATSPAEVEEAFHAAVDAYLAACAAEGRPPARAHLGDFNIRLSPEEHRALALWALRHDVLLNDAVKLVVTRFLRAARGQGASM